MMRLFRSFPISHFFPNHPLVLNISQLREDERIEFKYDIHHNLIAIQKIKLSLLEEKIEATAETDIEPNSPGRVFYNGSSWKAIVDGNMKVVTGQKVVVKARHNLTLFVIPLA